MDQADLCICVHTYEEHFGGNCSRVNCKCRKFVLLDCAPAIYEALNNAIPFLRRFAEHVTEKFGIAQSPVHQMLDHAEKLIAKAEGK